MSKNLWKSLKRYVPAFVVYASAFILVAPLIVYVNIFGATPSTDHARWAEFGSAMAGIYAPVVGFLTLVVLGFQISLQRQFSSQQLSQNFISSNTATFDTYLQRLNELLFKGPLHDLPADNIRRAFKLFDKDDIKDGDAYTQAFTIDRQHPNIEVTWGALTAILMIFSRNPDSMHQHAFYTSMLKIESYLDEEMRESLDSFHCVLKQGKDSQITYQFNKSLNKVKGKP